MSPRRLTALEICFPEETPLVEDITMDGPMITMLAYPLARRDLKCGEEGCGAPMDLRTSAKHDRPFYGCTRYPDCKGTHGAHSDGRPLGIPAGKHTRLARIQAHRVFDLIWKEKHRTRGQAYHWMRKKLGLTHDEAHIGKFDEATCNRLIAAVKEDFPVVRTAWDRILDADDFEDDFAVSSVVV